jgi:dCMP deaminase
LEEFYSELDKFDLADSEILRPKWDTYFMRIAHVTSTRTNCMKRAVGAVIVNDNRIVATGYNGTPFNTKNCNEGGCDRCNSNTVSGVGLDECICIHAEENAVIEGGRSKTVGGTCYVTTFPCLMCAKNLV